MGSMTDERRKEMEEEMMRFEQEIAFPADECPPGETKVKPLPPPPGPPDLGKIDKREAKENDVKTEEVEEDKPLKNVLPEVLTKPPPPPPPPEALQQRMSVNQQPGPPPSMIVPGAPEFPRMQGPRMPPMPGPPVHMAGHMQFIPHQLHRHPPRPPPAPPRPPMMQMRHLPGGFPPGPLPFPMHGPPMLPPMHMPLPPMGMPIPMGPGFCPPPPPAMSMRPMHMGPMNVPSQPFVPTSAMVNFHQPPLSSSKREDRTITSKVIIKSEPELASAPAVYAAPPMKSLSDKMAENSAVMNGQNTAHNLSNNPSSQQQQQHQQQIEEPKSAKTAEESVTAATTPVATNTEPVATKKEKKKKKVIRMAGGQAWEDNSLIDWDPDDFRIFCGDLGNDVTDEVLIRAFSKYSSFVKAKVIRDKRTNKTKGYGFVSFKDPQDFIKAMREMNGRYVGSRPIKLRKSTWRDRNIDLVRKKQKEKEKLGLL